MANENPMAQLAVDEEIDVSVVFAMRTPVDLTDGSGFTVEGTIISAPADRLIVSLDQGIVPGEGLQIGAELTIAAASEGANYEGDCELLEMEELAAVRLVTSRPTGVRRQVPLATAPWTTFLDDCSVYAAARVDPASWVSYPVTTRLLNVTSAMVYSDQEIPVGESTDFMYVIELGFPWEIGTVTLRARATSEGKSGDGSAAAHTYRLQFSDPERAAQETITRYINRSQVESRLQGNPGPAGPEGGRTEAGPEAVLGVSVNVRLASVELIDLDVFMTDLSRPVVERAQRLDNEAAEIAREIMAAPKPHNVRQATPIVHEMLDYMGSDPGLLESLVKGLSTDSELCHHSVNVSVYTVAMAGRLGITDETHLEQLATGAFLHDIGKSSVPEEILKKPDALNPSEWVVIRRHPHTGRALVAETGDFATIVLDCIEHHGERVNGSGYPDGLLGDDIPEAARIVAVADAFDALTVDKPWRPRFGLFEALLIMRDEMAGSFDRRILRIMIQALGDLLVARE